ncbi:hypothetical protein KBTX_02316 [wastewater metagenome]|uniref:Uncharacterized protein n=2 Tax=unclassified sequences TaxID=12908 RepID=A0A5B8RGZ4_9ZZZZ|nr:helix-turn-helix transcriptional regulator [Arhodomonas sp. KWT]QEA05987.1 hypothetical protein KBTEX_02316 [uncultured organism]
MRNARAERWGNPVWEARYVGCGLSLDEAAEWLGIHPRTLYRQEVGEARPAGPVLRALRLRAGDLGQCHQDWQGWRIGPDGLLYWEHLRRGFRPGEIAALPCHYQVAVQLRKMTREYRRIQALLKRRNRRF